MISTASILRKFHPSFTWDFPDEQDGVFLTFDDGPNPETTPWVLDTLKQYNARATFFCLGKNVEQYPETFKLIREAGHAVGNHTYSHQKGWGMSTGAYVEDVDLADEFMHSALFRPPYGRIGPNQARVLSERYKIVMWSVLSRDYSRHVSRTRCAGIVINHARPGSIIVFHDSKKSMKNLSYALPTALDFFAKQGWKTKIIE
ncbi:MAG: polysaccharide deacetylase family protein [Prevotellaceae bacterium]|jgi:peptidoglycan/xylan/chitin deacetylase (PgdA/CDA1 family)|nr:polysaccharide deacetylase family protein [Prevotellaceae bacterium]